jgi:tetratricopeptide (TPR) repeat protein
MHIYLKRLTVLITTTMLLACVGLGQRTPPAAAAPAPSADASYLTARAAHLEGRHQDALSHYQSALLTDPEHVNARNGLATLHAEQGDFARAIPLWNTLTATAKGPQGAFLFSNLGYAHFLNGDYTSALEALEQACLLDPLNHRAWEHLGAALEKLGQHGRAQQVRRQAAALQQHDFKADYAIAERSGVAAIDQAVQADTGRGSEWAASALPQGVGGVVEVQNLAHPPAPAVSQAPGKARLEIRNGNGVTGMARSLSYKMDRSSLQVVRLTNQKGFRVLQTRVEYQPAFREAAKRLAERFGSATVVEIEKSKAADLRLVIGHDLRRPTFALRPIAPASPADMTQTAGVLQ